MKSSSFCTLFFLAALILCISPLGFGQQPTATTVAGGSGGTPFSDTAIPSGGRVSEVYVFSGNAVDAVQMQFTLPDGRTAVSPRHGGPGGQQNTFRLDSDEYIVAISGRYGDYIDSLRIHTNRRTSPLFGGRGGSQDYRIDVADGNQAVGFVGRAGRYLDAVGLTFAPLMIQGVGQTTISGGRGGSAFSDDKIPMGARISEVRVRAGNTIDSIQAVYTLQDGRLLEGPIHGGGGGSPNVFRLDTNEYITGLSGRYGEYIDSLSIQTNMRTSQVFGGRGGSQTFGAKVPAGNRAIGFLGRSGEYLDAIGLLYAPTTTQQRQNRPNRFRIQR